MLNRRSVRKVESASGADEICGIGVICEIGEMGGLIIKFGSMETNSFRNLL